MKCLDFNTKLFHLHCMLTKTFDHGMSLNGSMFSRRFPEALKVGEWVAQVFFVLPWQENSLWRFRVAVLVLWLASRLLKSKNVLICLRWFVGVENSTR